MKERSFGKSFSYSTWDKFRYFIENGKPLNKIKPENLFIFRFWFIIIKMNAYIIL